MKDSATSVTDIIPLISKDDEEEKKLNTQTNINLSYFQAFKDTSKRTLPYTASLAIIVGTEFASVVLVSELGADALAACNLISSLQNWFISMGASLNATAIIAANKIGSGDREQIAEVGSVLHQSWIFSCLLSLPGVIIAALSDRLLVRLGQSPEISDLTQDYFNGYLLALPARFMLDANRRILLAIGKPSVGLAIDILYKIFNLGLCYCLIFGKLGFPEKGMLGFGMANAISTGVAFIGSTAYLMLGPSFKNYHFHKFNICKYFSYLPQLAKLGLPIGAKVAIELGSLLGASLMIGALSDDQLAAHEASFQYIFIISIPMFCLMESTTTLVSAALGAGLYRYAKKLGNASAILGTIMAALPLAAFATVPDIMLDAFIDTKDPVNVNIVETGRSLLLINGIAQIGDSLRNIYSGGLSGFKDTLIPTLIISASILGINLPLGYVLGFPVALQANGVMIARGVGMAFSAIIIAGLWFRKSSVAYQAVNTESTDINEIDLAKNENEANEKTQLLKKSTGSMSKSRFFVKNTDTKNRLEFHDEHSQLQTTYFNKFKFPCTIL